MQIEEQKIQQLSWIANRATSQTKELYQLCNCNFDTLMELEAKIKSNRLFYCPGSKQEIDKILQLPLNP